MKKLILTLLSLFIVISLTKHMIDYLVEETDEKNMAENSLKNTEHIKGEVIEKKDKSYMKKEGYALFMGGGERKIEDYQIKLKYDKEKYKTIKIDENDYLNVNKEDVMNIVVDNENNTIKYDLKEKEDKKTYEHFKKVVK